MISTMPLVGISVIHSLFLSKRGHFTTFEVRGRRFKRKGKICRMLHMECRPSPVTLVWLTTWEAFRTTVPLKGGMEIESILLHWFSSIWLDGHIKTELVPILMDVEKVSWYSFLLLRQEFLFILGVSYRIHRLVIFRL